MERAIPYQSKSQKREVKSKNSFFREIRKNQLMYLLMLPGILLIFVFAYLPMFGIVIAFQDYNAVKGIMGSEFVGFKNFKFFVESSDVLKVILNTLFLNFLFILFGTIASVSIAIVLSELKAKKFKSITQTIITLPNFLSWTVVATIVTTFFTQSGIVNQIVGLFGKEPISFLSEASYWPLILVCLKLWHGAGFGSIVYLAAISGINPDIYESASLDGASRWDKIRYITLPLLKPTIFLLLLLALGGIFYGDIGMIFAIIGGNSVLYPTTDVIDTYVLRALLELGNISMSSAISFFQSLVGFLLVVTVNQLARKFSPDSALY